MLNVVKLLEGKWVVFYVCYDYVYPITFQQLVLEKTHNFSFNW